MENGEKSAFGVTLKENGNAFHPDAMGLTKREYFAVLILQNTAQGNVADSSIKSNTEFAIKYADELLKQLSKS